jgi:hypothetical protein
VEVTPLAPVLSITDASLARQGPGRGRFCLDTKEREWLSTPAVGWVSLGNNIDSQTVIGNEGMPQLD